MQNADNEASKSQTTRAEQDEEGAAAAAAYVEGQLQLEEDQAKLNTRSRFAAAFRSFSKPKSKKPKELPKEKPKSEEQLALLSGAEEDQSIDSGLKKKRSLTRRLLLGGLKSKTKVRPQSLATSDEISLRSSSSRERAADALPTSSGSSTLQITISGKKVETAVKGKAAKSSSSSKAAKSKSHNSETDYLTPIPTTTTTAEPGSGKSTSTTTTLTTISREDTKTSSSSRSTKLIVAKVSASNSKQKLPKQPKQAKQPKLKSTTTATAASSVEQEKIVITESRRDTPPHERAPAKPSRANANQLATSSGAVRKSSSSSSSATNLATRKERDLLQQQQQRGHRIKHRALGSINNGTTAAPASPVQALETPPIYSPPPPPPLPPPPTKTSTIALVSLSDVEEQTDAVSLAESAGTQPPVVRFAVGSAVRGPAADADAYEAAVVAAATQQPSSSEEPSDSSLRRHSFANQKLTLSDHDSIEGRRETVHYKSVQSGDSYAEDSVSEEDVGGEAKPMPAFGDLTMDQEMEPTIMAPSSEKREHLYKILVIGELGTGKTSFIKRYVHQFFSQNYRATIGVDFALKVLHWDTNTIVRLQLWDIAGQERFGNMTRVYYKEAVGAFIVFDVTRSGTFDCVSKWKEDLDSKVQLPDGSPIPCILLANKCDQEKQGIVTQPERMDEYVRENGFAGWFETSAKENINIDEAARALVNKILINDKLIAADANDAEKFNLSNADTSSDSKSKCTC